MDQPVTNPKRVIAMKLTTTLNRIRACSPCVSGWRTLNTALGSGFNQDEEIDLLTILDSNGVQDTLWCLRATIQDSKRIAATLAILFAEQALPIFEAEHQADQRPRLAIQAARDFLETGNAAAYAAARAAARAAADAAYAAADAADAAADAAYAAADAAADAAYAAAYAAAVESQAEIIRLNLV